MCAHPTQETENESDRERREPGVRKEEGAETGQSQGKYRKGIEQTHQECGFRRTPIQLVPLLVKRLFQASA